MANLYMVFHLIDYRRRILEFFMKAGCGSNFTRYVETVLQ